MIFVIDFDGTVSTQDTVDQLLAQHADPAWQELEDAWLQDRISAVECMQGQIRLVRADARTLAAFYRSMRIDPNFRAFSEHVRSFAALAIVSDGLDQAIHACLGRHGISELPVYANHLERILPDRLELHFPLRQSSCQAGNGVCKCAVAQDLAAQHGGPTVPIVLVGDGKSDACLAARADIVFAKGSLIEHCRAQQIAHTPFETFADVLRVVRGWPQARPLPVAA
ncbi:HAD-IB family phosphatase [Extensimonas sp. H3M7-6]|uniref:HAD-IB family phosphatase n=1 Tax=Extensimonas soli TaxID=3031322 RepID=UPI0023DAD716|nr:HAD-IB family phosphatase [Extensimonas sp. H3M7-6]MDF1481660.1 HAD-IB family phosphatase [Extensimonas sp. H3M7-6]